MNKIIALGASNSTQSINKKLATWTAHQLPNASVEVLDLNDFEMPIYSIDREKENGIHAKAEAFKAKIEQADGIIISFAEHNGSYTAAFKNVSDWVSRIDKKIWSDKPTLILATSPGGRGGLSVLQEATRSLPRLGAQVAGSFSLPSFGQNFDSNEGIKDQDLLNSLNEHLRAFEELISQNPTL
jgi:NAD(P)H-dependent FMN reductase